MSALVGYSFLQSSGDETPHLVNEASRWDADDRAFAASLGGGGVSAVCAAVSSALDRDTVYFYGGAAIALFAQSVGVPMPPHIMTSDVDAKLVAERGADGAATVQRVSAAIASAMRARALAPTWDRLRRAGCSAPDKDVLPVNDVVAVHVVAGGPFDVGVVRVETIFRNTATPVLELHVYVRDQKERITHLPDGIAIRSPALELLYQTKLATQCGHENMRRKAAMRARRSSFLLFALRRYHALSGSSGSFEFAFDGMLRGTERPHVLDEFYVLRYASDIGIDEAHALCVRDRLAECAPMTLPYVSDGAWAVSAAIVRVLAAETYRVFHTEGMVLTIDKRYGIAVLTIDGASRWCFDGASLTSLLAENAPRTDALGDPSDLGSFFDRRELTIMFNCAGTSLRIAVDISNAVAHLDAGKPIHIPLAWLPRAPVRYELAVFVDAIDEYVKGLPGQPTLIFSPA